MRFLDCKFVLILIILFFDINVINAHLDAGGDKVVNGYLIDFGYAPVILKADQKSVFAVNLVNDTTKEVINPDKVWIRISSSKDSVLAGNFRPEAGSVAFTFTFPHADTYEVTTRFFKDENLLVETDFELNVTQESFNYYNIAILVVVLLISFLILRKILLRKNKN